MPIIRQQPSKNYFASIDFFLRTTLFVIATTIIILQHILTSCKSQYRPIDVYIYEFFTPSFGTSSWSATGLYVTCWTMIVLYIHTILLVFMDNFQIQYHATTFVIQDIITSILFLAWTIMNILQLSDCSKRQLTSHHNETLPRFEKPFCGSVPCSVYLAPSIGCFIAMFIAVSLADIFAAYLVTMPAVPAGYSSGGQIHKPSCFDRVKIGFTMGFTVGMVTGIVFGGFTALRYGLRGRELLTTVGKSVVSAGGTFGTFMAIGSAIRC